MIPGERIKEIRRRFCDNDNTAFSQQMEEKPNTTSNWMSRGVSYDIGMRILLKFPLVRRDWLFDGHGEMTETDTNEPPQTGFATQMEFDFNKWIGVAEKNADSLQELISIHGGVARSNEKLTDSNAKLVDQLVETLSRIEKKIDDREGVVSSTGGMLQTGR